MHIVSAINRTRYHVPPLVTHYYSFLLLSCGIIFMIIIIICTVCGGAAIGCFLDETCIV